MHGNEFGLEQGFEVRFDAPQNRAAHGRADFAVKLFECLGTDMRIALPKLLDGFAEFEELFCRGALKESIEPAGNPKPLGRAIGDSLHLRKKHREHVPAALDRATAFAASLGHFIEGHALGAGCQHPGQLKQRTGFFVTHGPPTSDSDVGR